MYFRKAYIHYMNYYAMYDKHKTQDDVDLWFREKRQGQGI